jgi:hypothetical protein
MKNNYSEILNLSFSFSYDSDIKLLHSYIVRLNGEGIFKLYIQVNHTNYNDWDLIELCREEDRVYK